MPEKPRLAPFCSRDAPLDDIRGFISRNGRMHTRMTVHRGSLFDPLIKIHEIFVSGRPPKTIQITKVDSHTNWRIADYDHAAIGGFCAWILCRVAG